jgi:hypothetical protein
MFSMTMMFGSSWHKKEEVKVMFVEKNKCE